MRRAVPLVLLATLGVVACSDEPAAQPAPATTATTTPTTTTTTTSRIGSTSESASSASPSVTTETSDVVVPEGYARVRATVTEPDGTVCELCLWLADTAELRRSGLMLVTDLGEADGMAFVYPDPHTGTFWMKNTLLPLSIAFFSPTGEYLDAFDMEPCTADPCRQYPTPVDFLVAIETRQGDLAELGIVPGSVLDLTDLPCDEI